MADALANVIAVFPSTDFARWIVARLTPNSAQGPQQPNAGGPELLSFELPKYSSWDGPLAEKAVDNSFVM